MNQAAVTERRRDDRGWVGYVALVGAVWLGWQITSQAVIDRLPPSIALRIAPTSAVVLSRAAELEYAAKRPRNAAPLARDALAHAPFDVRALRVTGLTEAAAGRVDQADQIVTLAGNWSLRDDPSHVWLMQQRLLRGDYHSAFAHADTLARRREDVQPQLFRLFATAASQDRRSLPHLASLLAGAPPWKATFLQSLYDDPGGLGLAAQLAILLQASRSPMSTEEVSQLNRHLIAKGLFPAMRQVRVALGRPPADQLLVNGGFSPQSQPEPYEWALISAPGVFSQIAEDPVRNDSALRVEDAGYTGQPTVQQVLELPAGPYVFSGQVLAETGPVADRLVWTIVCYESSLVIARPVVAGPLRPDAWRTMNARFTVPTTGCSAQVIRLTPQLPDRHQTVAAWYDRFTITAP